MELVRTLRQARGWTQQHLADAAGLSLRTVQRTEAGEGSPSKETLLALSGVFEVSVAPKTPQVCVERFVWGHEGNPCVPSCRIVMVDEIWLEGVELQHVPDLGSLTVCVNEQIARWSVDAKGASDLSYEVQEGNVLYFAGGRVQDGDVVEVSYAPRLVVAAGVP